MTLLDWPGKVACTVFLEGCDLRCPYCHNSELLLAGSVPGIREEELLSFLEKRKGLLDGVCVTGGEALLWPDLPFLLEKIKAIGYPVKLDTNGTHPEKLKMLFREGLIDYVAMDIKNSPEKYGVTAGKPDLNLEPVRESVSWLLEEHTDYEFRTTVVRQFHTVRDMEEIGRWIAGAKRYFLQPFAPRNTVPDQTLAAPDRETLCRFLETVKPLVKEAEIRGI